MKGEHLPQPVAVSAARPKRCRRSYFLAVFAVLSLLFTWVCESVGSLQCLGISLTFQNHFSFSRSLLCQSKKARFQKCSIDTYRATGLEFLKAAERPPLEEYVLRRNNLAKALVADGVDAFVVEPGYTFSYYANVTQPECTQTLTRRNDQWLTSM